MLENSTIVIVTGAELIVLAAATGAVVGDLWVLPSGKSPGPPQTLAMARIRLWRLLGWCLGVYTLCNAAELLLRTADMSDLAIPQAFPEIATVLSKTHYGHLWLWRGAALLAAWIAWGVYRRKYGSRASAAGFIALAVIALTLSASGHAGDDGILSLANLADWLHILGAFLWGGGIIATAVIIFPVLLRAPQPEHGLAATAGLRLSSLAGMALGMVLISGIYNAWLQIGTWHGLWSTLYGQLLVAKLLLVAGMTALGAVNRYRYVPALQRRAGRPEPRMLFPLPRFLRAGNDAASAVHFLRSLWVETVLLLGVLILAAALSQQTPAAHAEHDGMPEHMHSDIQGKSDLFTLPFKGRAGVGMGFLIQA